jgi:acetyl-CoA C-acetyltransferase
MTREVVVVAGCRTAQGTFGGALRDVPAHELLRPALQEVVKRAGIDPALVKSVTVGQVYQTSQALNLARFTALEADLPFTVTGATVNSACCSSLEAFNNAAREIAIGDSDVAIAAGVESMSCVPFLLHGHRWGTRRGNSEVVDQFEESTWSASTYKFGKFSMGMAADHVAKVYGIPRREQDEYALRSHQLAMRAIDAGHFVDEIVPVTVKGRKEDVVFAVDEHPRRDTTIETLSRLRPSFGGEGTVTAGNASGITDGAAAMLLMAADKAAELGVKPLLRVRSTARFGVDPRLICMSPGPAARAALERIGAKAADVGWWEINEAFASVVLSSCRELGIGLDGVNPSGGGIAIGHPMGCSGVRTLVTMMYGMRRTGAQLGVASIGGGGGIGTATVVELAA